MGLGPVLSLFFINFLQCWIIFLFNNCFQYDRYYLFALANTAEQAIFKQCCNFCCIKWTDVDVTNCVIHITFERVKLCRILLKLAKLVNRKHLKPTHGGVCYAAVSYLVPSMNCHNRTSIAIIRLQWFCCLCFRANVIFFIIQMVRKVAVNSIRSRTLSIKPLGSLI